MKHAVQAQNLFRHLVRRAEDIGMKVNTGKTSMICVSDALAYTADAFINDADGVRIGCQDSIKALGMHFSAGLSFDIHLDSIKRKFRSRYWMLRNLKQNGFNSLELTQVYKSMIRPVAEYEAVVFHSSLTDKQDEALER